MIRETIIDCRCDRPLLVDETAISMGVNCFKCGRSAEHILTARQKQLIRLIQRARRRNRERII